MTNSKNSNTTKFLKGVSSQTLVTIVLGLVEIVSFSIMSRLLTRQDFGYYAALSAILVVFNSFAQTGIGSSIIQRKEIDQKFINNAFTLALCFGTVLSLMLFLLSDILANMVVDESMGMPLKLMSLTILCHCLTSPYISVLYKQLKFMIVGYINLISLIITTIIAILLAYQGFGYYAIITRTVLGAFLTLILAAIISKTKFSIEWDKNIIKSIWNYSGWLMASVVFRNFSQQADRLLMSRLLSVDVLGCYNRPKEFINQISTKFNGIFDTALFPVLSGIQDNIPSLQRAFKKSMYLMNLFSIMLTLIFLLNAELFIRVFFGSEWLNLTGILQTLSFALVFNIDGRLADCYLRSLALTKSQFYFRVVETIIKFGGVIVGSYYGIYGVAIAVVISNFAMIFVKVSYISRYIKMSGVIVIRQILAAWRPLLLYIPIIGGLEYILPHTFISNILVSFVFCVLSILCFVCFPSLIGHQYKISVHQNLVQGLHKRFLWKRK